MLEPLAGYLLLAERLWNDASAAEAWNFGPASIDVKPVCDIVDRVTQVWGPGARWHTIEEADARHEAHLLALDSSKAQARLNWRPRLRLDTALEWTLRWYRDYLSGQSALDLILRDIAGYEAQEKAYL